MLIRLISIGDELLSGRTVNTNASWLGEQFASMGYRVDAVETISDDRGVIRRAVENASAVADLVVVTGGLGPTEDDVTREAICDLLDCDMKIDDGQLELIRRRFAELGRAVTERNERQARVPSACEAIPNSRGTAPGLSFRYGRGTVYVLPGVPTEMRGLFSLLRSERIPPAEGFTERVWVLYGIPESHLADRLEPVTAMLDEKLGLAYLPAEGPIRLRLVRYAGDAEAQERYERAASMIESLAAEWIVSDRNEPLAATLGRELTELGLTVATAESCTGGLIGAAITDIPGSSLYYPGGIVSYGNRQKEELLGVPGELMEEHGAVSDAVALAMAAGARERLGVDYAVAVTGIAGPDGGTPEKPVGTVWIAVASGEGVRGHLFRFRGERDTIRRYTVNAALAAVIRQVRGERSDAASAAHGAAKGDSAEIR